MGLFGYWVPMYRGDGGGLCTMRKPRGWVGGWCWCWYCSLVAAEVVVAGWLRDVDCANRTGDSDSISESDWPDPVEVGVYAVSTSGLVEGKAVVTTRRLLPV